MREVFDNLDNKKIKNELKKLKKETHSPLKKYVINWLLDYDSGEIEGALQDLLNHGCVSGMVGSLIYYNDTIPFAKKHIEEIMLLLEETEEETGERLKMTTPYLNWLAWFGFEETARKIADELEIEI